MVFMRNQKSPRSYGNDSHFIENENGIEYLYAWLDKHPNVRAMAGD
jgi:hypothetical protein